MRLSITIVVDRSTSTQSFINELNNLLEEILKAIRFHPQLQGMKKMVSVLHFPQFSDSRDNNINKFEAPFDIDQINPDEFSFNLNPRGHTDPTYQLSKAIKIGTEQTEKWSADGFRCARPIIFYITDGKPDAGVSKEQPEVDPLSQRALMSRYEKLGDTIKNLEDKENLLFIGFGISDQNNPNSKADIETMRMLTNYANHILDYTNCSSIDTAFQRILQIIPATISTDEAVNIISEILR